VFSIVLDVIYSIARTKDIFSKIKLLKDIESKAQSITKSFGPWASRKPKENEYWVLAIVGVKDPFFNIPNGTEKSSLEIWKNNQANKSNVREDMRHLNTRNHRISLEQQYVHGNGYSKTQPIEINYKSFFFFTVLLLIIDEKEIQKVDSNQKD